MTANAIPEGPIRRFVADAGNYRWGDVDLLRYKDDATSPFRDVTRQTLFHHPDMRGELRYFEVAADGYSTLERHAHAHAVMVLRGSGRALIGEHIHDIGAFDLVTVSPLTWHQFRASPHEALGFLCMVDVERDKPQLPGADEMAQLCTRLDVAAFLGYAVKPA